MVEEYHTDDAEYILMTNGSAAGNVKSVIDEARVAGLKVGLARIRLFRPYPREEIVRILKGKKACGVIDRSICLGWNCGHLFMEARAAMAGEEGMPKILSFIDGLSSMDITKEHIELALGMTMAAGNGEPVEETNWLSWE
ncbi:NADH-dependent phenylglyoxylate dehydrogenase subunit alpha [bioreactor metagenome]|uniref:NADH-dependent phenylglyoxylate dehydrogenase subunit alpha n=1 Tax=bioreactor metagenome TaxID=1076179 RepID=A0A645JJ41_9ZZZZ